MDNVILIDEQVKNAVYKWFNLQMESVCTEEWKNYEKYLEANSASMEEWDGIMFTYQRFLFFESVMCINNMKPKQKIFS